MYRGKYNKLILDENEIQFVKSHYEQGESQPMIAKQLNISVDKVLETMRENGIKVRSNREQALKYKCDESYFENIDTPEKAYWLGFLYADGFLERKRKHSNGKFGISLALKDKKSLIDLSNALKSNYKIPTYETSSGYKIGVKYSKLIISSPKIVNDLLNLGMNYNKSFNLDFPTDEQVPKYLKLHFIRGFTDGDGSIYSTVNKKGHREATIKWCGTYNMMMGLKEFLNINVKTKLSQRHPDRNNNNYNYQVGGNIQFVKVMNMIYKDSTEVTRMERKFKIYLQILKEINIKEYNKL